MSKDAIPGGPAHKMPKDLQRALEASPKALSAWGNITPLARNEWICWTISVKTSETRSKHITRAISELAAGKRRPCCWMGCVHRTDKQLSPTQKWVLGR